MEIKLTPEERISFLVIMAGGMYRALDNIYRKADGGTKASIMRELAASMAQLEPVMDMYGLGRDPEGIARGMMLTEDLIGCQPAGKLLSVSPDEAVREVTACPWAGQFAPDGGTCNLVMAAVNEGLANKHGLEVRCDKSIAGGADRCVWRVYRK
jgi:hypothetical protein